MKRFVILLAFFTLFGSAPARAQQIDFANLTCDGDTVVQIVKSNMKALTFQGGGRVTRTVDLRLVGRPSFRSSTDTTLLCNGRFSASAGGETQRVRGLLTFTLYPDGRIGYLVTFNY